MTEKLTRWQIEVLRCAYTAFDSKLTRGSSAVWYRAPMAIRALAHKGYLELRKNRTEARITEKGRELVEADPKRFGVTIGKPYGIRARCGEAPGAHGQVGRSEAHAERAPKEPKS